METLFTDINVWLIAKIFALLLLGMYLVFSLVVVRQVKMMTDTLQLGFESLAKTLSWLHMGFAILVFLTALVIL
ncbi:MAG: hypothetical protein HYV90_01035 [Candidatus Woesebacteria bacterium]|nr:MAG: hypothetical protein HYV90_01035 [Candidatus Woesebacteria bacterium]